MNFKKNWKRFWTLSRSAEGFTLVELIVVIAILAILAGVAVPAYSGYIEKANKAGDLQLLAAVNTAFAAAALENGTDMNQVNAANLTYSSSEGAVTVTGVASVNGAANAAYDEAFQRYYSGNTGTFKVIKTLAFDSTKHVFVDPSSVDSLTLNYGGGTITVSAALLNAWAASENLAGIGVDGLLGQVTDASKLATYLMTESDYKDQYLSALSGTAYKENLAKAAGFESVSDMKNKLGIEGVDLTAQTIAQYIAMDNALAASGLGMTAAEYMSNSNPNDEKYLAAQSYLASNMKDPTTVIANNAILTAASNTSGKTAAEILDTVKNGVNVNELNDLKTTGDAQTLADASAVYVMYAAYCKQNGTTADMSNLSQVLTDLSADGKGESQSGFQAYLNTPEAKADAEAYLQAINAINSGTADPSVQQSILVNGFSDSELNMLLGSVLGG